VEAFLNRLAFFAVFFLLFLASAVFADPGVYQNNKKAVLYLGSAPPVVDGNVADWAGLLGTSPEKFAYGKLRATKDPSAVIVWRTDNKKLFIYAEVTDSVANENDLPAPLAWRNDSLELYIGTDTSSHIHYVPTDNQIRLVPVSRDDATKIGVSVNDRIVDTERDVEGRVIYTDTGYRIEAAVPLRLLRIKEFAVGQAIRCDFQLNDANTGERENLTHWNSKSDNTYFDPSAWGDGVVEALSGAK